MGKRGPDARFVAHRGRLQGVEDVRVARCHAGEPRVSVVSSASSAHALRWPNEKRSTAPEKYHVAPRLAQKRKRMLDVALVRGSSVDGLRGR
jgi:hypothetical protein